MEYGIFYVLFMSVNLGITFVIMLAACLCCRKKIPKNEFLGLEGMVKIKNPEESIDNADTSLQIDISSSTAAGETDSKRASNAPHRSLPDIPVNDSINDNGSELYATVADKVQEKPQGRSPISSFKKQASVSQHSSISQADDVSSPYARVKTPPHDYDKVRSTEHPYAQLNAPGPSSTHQPIFEKSPDSSPSQGDSNQSLLGDAEPQQEIPAASAIAGMVSASQELPYMTPPIVPHPHFSGDSQDSSKGYTSISVREPLANILAQTKHSRPRMLPKDTTDSHYATVSDDSDEMYAAIDDPNNRGDIYTSGSETYAQIQPANPIIVSVEINTNARIQEHPEPSRLNSSMKSYTVETPIHPPVDSLRAQMHSRQASSSSNTSSVGILGSPKPEKRQANSPLPPTPKILQFNSNTNLTSTSSVPSERNSIASVIECPLPQNSRIASKESVTVESDDATAKKKSLSPSKDIEGMYAKVMKKNKLSNAPSQNSSPVLNRKKLSRANTPEDAPPDLIIKNIVPNKLQTSPGKSSVKSTSYLENSYETIDKRRVRCNSYSKDHGYETIPADKVNGNNNLFGNRKSEGYTPVLQSEALDDVTGISNRNPILDKLMPSDRFPLSGNEFKLPSEPGYESLPDQSLLGGDHGYEALLKLRLDDDAKNPNSDYDPNYEILQPGKYSNTSDDGYAKVWEKQRTDDDSVDGYSRVKEREEEDQISGYSSIKEKKLHDYASIKEAEKEDQIGKPKNISNNNNGDLGLDIYSSISNEQPFPYIDTAEEFHNYQTIGDTKLVVANVASGQSKSSDKLTTPSTGHSSPDTQMKCSSTSNTISSSQHQSSSNYESLTGSESDPNYESVRYLDSENPYERLHSDTNISPDVLSCLTPLSGDGKVLPLRSSEPTQPPNSDNGEVEDYFQV